MKYKKIWSKTWRNNLGIWYYSCIFYKKAENYLFIEYPANQELADEITKEDVENMSGADITYIKETPNEIAKFIAKEEVNQIKEECSFLYPGNIKLQNLSFLIHSLENLDRPFQH